jgi:hypothetical protein
VSNTGCGKSCFRHAFLQREHVKGFVDYLVNLCCSQEGVFTHDYLDRKRRKQWQCSSLKDAYAKYEWNGSDSATNALTLKAWSTTIAGKLQSTGEISAQDNSVVIDICKKIQEWGGTDSGGQEKGNIPAIDELNKAQQGGIIGYLRATQAKLLRYANDGDEQGLRGIRSNAGFTKIYSLAYPAFIIYDSRVAAALGYLACLYLKTLPNAPATLPIELSFSRMNGYENKNAGNPKNRNASEGPYRFPFGSSGQKHLLSNTRANWILGRVCEEADPLWGKTPTSEALRALESALFMVGYDLPKSATGNSVGRTGPRENSVTKSAPPTKMALARDYIQKILGSLEKRLSQYSSQKQASQRPALTRTIKTAGRKLAPQIEPTARSGSEWRI